MRTLFKIRVGASPITGGGFASIDRTTFTGSLKQAKTEATRMLVEKRGSSVVVTSEDGRWIRSRTDTGVLKPWQ